MSVNPRTHVLVAVSDTVIGGLVRDAIEIDLAWCRVTLTSRADDAFAVARASLHSLVVVVDQTGLAMVEDGLIRLFTEHADQLPPLAWVALMGTVPHPIEEVQTFLAATDASIVLTPFDVEAMLAVVERAAGRLARRVTAEAARA